MMKMHTQRSKKQKTYSLKIAKKSISFSDVIDEIVGKNIIYLEIDEKIIRYILEITDKLKNIEYINGILLFGSIAKGRYNEYSDIDILVIINNNISAIKAIEDVSKLTGPKSSIRHILEENHLPFLISPAIISLNQLTNFKPIYLDFLDYGIILYEKNHVISEFINMLKNIKYKRKYTQYGEMIEWNL